MSLHFTSCASLYPFYWLPHTLFSFLPFLFFLPPSFFSEHMCIPSWACVFTCLDSMCVSIWVEFRCQSWLPFLRCCLSWLFCYCFVWGRVSSLAWSSVCRWWNRSLQTVEEFTFDQFIHEAFKMYLILSKCLLCAWYPESNAHVEADRGVAKAGLATASRTQRNGKWSFVQSQASSCRAGPAWSIEMHAVGGWMSCRTRSAEFMPGDRGWRDRAMHRAPSWTVWLDRVVIPEKAVPAGSLLWVPKLSLLHFFTTILGARNWILNPI